RAYSQAAAFKVAVSASQPFGSERSGWWCSINVRICLTIVTTRIETTSVITRSILKKAWGIAPRAFRACLATVVLAHAHFAASFGGDELIQFNKRGCAQGQTACLDDSSFLISLILGLSY
ncbi:hypothetical protein L914_04997, partial [Phytophthora nicotianae]